MRGHWKWDLNCLLAGVTKISDTLLDILNEEGVSEDSLSGVFVETRYVKTAFQQLDSLMRMPKDRNHAWGMAIIGPARTGKTTLLAEYLKSCNRGERGRKPLKHLYVRLVPDTRMSNIASTTLRWMNDPSPAHGTPEVKSGRVWEAIVRRDYDIIIYDEVHFLVDSDTQRVEEKGAAWFNELLNQRRCPVVLLGYERLNRAIERNASLQGRLLPCPASRPWDFGNMDDLNEVGLVLGYMEKRLGFPRASGLSKQENVERICFSARACSALSRAS